MSYQTSDIFIEDWDPIESTEPEIHHLPCNISHNGFARVSTFFRPKTSSTNTSVQVSQSDKVKFGLSSTIKRATFRGRYLRGVELTLPESYSGVIFREEEGENLSKISHLFDDEEKLDDATSAELVDLRGSNSNVRTWSVQSLFQKFTYWTRKAAPKSDDPPIKWIEWMSLIGPSLHVHLTAEDLQAPFKYNLNSSPNPTSTDTEKAETNGHISKDDNLPHLAESQHREAKRKRRIDEDDGREGNDETNNKEDNKISGKKRIKVDESSED